MVTAPVCAGEVRTRMASGSEQISISSSQLSKLSEELRGLVEQFKFTEEKGAIESPAARASAARPGGNGRGHGVNRLINALNV